VPAVCLYSSSWCCSAVAILAVHLAVVAAAVSVAVAVAFVSIACAAVAAAAAAAVPFWDLAGPLNLL